MKTPGWVRLEPMLVCAALAAVLILGVMPYRVYLGFWPMTMDATVWIDRSAITTPGWWRWDLCSSHFIGYRPLAAISFSVDSLIGGFAPWAYRSTNMILHGLGGLGVFLAFRALHGSRGRWGAVLAAAIFLAHPAGEGVVPILARRSYLLCAVFSAASVPWLVAACRAGGARTRSAVATACMVALAILSNEEGYVLVVALPVLAWHLRRDGTRGWWERLRPTAGILVAALLVFLLRLAATHELGGYGSSVPEPAAFLSTSTQALRGLFFPHSPDGAAPLVPGGLLARRALVVYLVVACLLAPAWSHLRARRDEEASRPASLAPVLLFWIGGYVLLGLLTDTWSRRQVYPVLVPLALLVATLAQELPWRDPRRWPGWLGAPFLAWTLLALFGRSPAIHGVSARKVEAAASQQARLESAVSALRDLPARSVVHLASPTGKPQRASRAEVPNLWYQGGRTASWLGALSRERDLRVRDLAFLTPPAGEEGEVEVRYELVDGRPTLVVASDVKVTLPRYERVVELSEGPDEVSLLRLDTLPTTPGRARFVAWFEGAELRVVPLGEAARSPEKDPGAPGDTGDQGGG